jgi:adenylylsulfate kinase-like enzyme
MWTTRAYLHFYVFLIHCQVSKYRSYIRRMKDCDYLAGEVAKLFADAGVICIVSVISPYRKDRDACRKLFRESEFVEVLFPC